MWKGSSHTVQQHFHRSNWFVILSVCFVTTVLSVSAQIGDVPGSWRPVNPFPEEEAPPYLLDLDVGDTEVELFMLGSWTASSVVATSFAIHPPLPESGDRVTWGYPYPNFETRLFDQTVDLTVSLWLYKRYFFEASFADDSDVNTIAAGYYAVDDELVKEFVVGNVPLAVSRYPYQYAGNRGSKAGRKPHPGTVLRLQTDRTFHEFLVQLENSTQERIRISGGRIIEEARIRPEDYLQGRAFILPDGGVSNVEVVIQEDNGDLLGTLFDGGTLQRFRALDPDAGDYVIDTADGTVRLAEGIPNDTVVAVYYETASGSVGSPSNGRNALAALESPGTDAATAPTTGRVDFDFGINGLYGFAAIDPSYGAADYDGADFRLALSDGRDFLILRAPGLWTPFEAANLYSLPDGAGEDLRFQLIRRNSDTTVDTDIRLQRVPGTALLRADRDDASVRSLGYQYPWAEEAPRDTNARIYGPRANEKIDLAESEIFLRYGNQADTLLLNGDVVPGSVAITSDGRTVPGATVDYDTGEIELPGGIANAGTVDVSYRVYGEDGDTTDLVVINGNRWQPRTDLEVSLATGLRWTLTENGYSTELNQHPGQLTISSGVAWAGDELRVEASGAAQISQSDTTGYMRLYGSSVEDTSISPDAETVVPSAAAETLSTRTDLYDDGNHSGTDPDLSATNRVLPRYRDYWTSDALGNVTLQSYPSLPDADDDRSNARIGPYLARSNDSEYTGTVAILEWDEIPDGRWTGARINRGGEDIDLSDAASIIVTYRYINDGGVGGAPKLLFEMGSLGEDLDGDGSIDTGPSAVDPTFEFDTPLGPRRAGQDAPSLARPHSEDANRNGVLDLEPASAVFSHLLTDDGDGVAGSGDTASEGWKRVEIPLGPSDRSRLKSVRAARIVAAASGSDVPAGRVLIGDILLRRTRSVVLTSPGVAGTGRTAVVPDPLTGGASLRSQEETVGSRFVPETSDQRVVEIAWEETAGSVTAEFPIPDFSTRAYGTIRGYFFLDAEPTGALGETVTLTLRPYRSAPQREQVVATIPADRLTGGWHEVAILLTSEEVEVDGSRVPGAVEIGGDVDDVTLAIGTLTIDGIGPTGIGAGSLYFDELHASEATTGFALAGRVHADWRRTIATGPLEGSEFYLSQTVAAEGEDFQAAGSASADAVTPEEDAIVPGRGAVATESRAGFNSGNFRVEGEVLARDSAVDSDAAFGHTIQTPLAPSGFIIANERFFRDYRTSSAGFERQVGLSVGNGRFGRYTGENRQIVSSFDTEQSWGVALAPPAIGPFSLSLQSDASLFAPQYDLVTESYSDTWARSNGLIAPIPESQSPQERRHTGKAQVGLGPVELGSTIGWTNRSSLSGEQEHLLGLDASLPLEFAPAGRRPWGLTPSYRREYSFTEEVESTRFREDADRWGDRVAAEPIPFTAPPVVELFAPDGPGSVADLKEDQLGRTYESEGRIRFNRAFSSRTSDLWTPADIEALVQRSLSWEGTTVQDTRLWQTSITAIAINLFGVDGSRPRTSLYQSDEFRNAIILGYQEYPRSDRTPEWSIGLEQESGFIGNGENRLDLLTTLDLSGGDTMRTELGHQLAYLWDRFGYPKLAVFERMEEKPFYRHEERLTISYARLDGEFDGSEITAGHVTRLVITEQGSISAFGDIGWIVDPGEYEDGALHLVGLRFGIEGRLTY